MAAPRTCEDLTAAINAQWSLVTESVKSHEVFAVKNANTLKDGEITHTHFVVVSGGLKPEGRTPDSHQLFFTEEEAIKALWFQYNKLTPHKDLEIDAMGILFCWRDYPEVDEHYGTYRARMRYSVVYKNRHGELFVPQNLAA